MLALTPLLETGTPLRILCLGAHSDDIEIGALGTLLTLAKQRPGSELTWAVFTAHGERLTEARESAEAAAETFSRLDFVPFEFEDGYFPAHYADVKRAFVEVRERCEPDLVFTHYQGDAHQDHRVVAELTWQTFRNHMILEYEIPKFEGDLGNPSCFVPVADDAVSRKIAILERYFGSQRSKTWFSAETFRSLMHLRGIQAKSPTGFAEAFYCRKLLLTQG